MAGELEFLLEIDAKMDGLTKMVGVVDDSIKALKDLHQEAGKTEHALDHTANASEKAGQAHKRHGHELWQLGHQYEYVKNGVNEFAEAIGLVLAFEAVEKIVEKVKELGEEIIHAAGKAERAEVSFKLLLGAEEGGELLEYIEQIAQHTEFTDDELKGMTQGLLKAGFAAKEIPRALAAGLDIASFSANATEGFSTALGAMERLKRTGHVDNRVLGGLGFGEKDFFGQLTKRTGKPLEVLKKELESGKGIGEALETLNDLISKRTGKALGAAGVSMSKTLEARIKHLKDIPDQMYQGLAKTEPFAKLSDFIGNLADDLGPEGRIGSTLVGNLERAFSTSVDFITGLDWDSMLVTAVDLGKDFFGVVKSIAEAFEGFVDTMNQLEDTMETVLTLGHLTDKLGITHQGDRTSRMYAAIGQDPDVLAAKARQSATHERLQAFKTMRSFQGLGPGLSEGLFNGVAHSLGKAGSAGELIGKAAIDGAKNATDTHSPSRVFEEIGRMSAEGYAIGLEKSSSRIDDATSSAIGDTVPRGSFARPASGGAPSGPIEVTINVTTNVGGGSSTSAEEISVQTAEQVEATVLAAFQRVLENLQNEAGA